MLAILGVPGAVMVLFVVSIVYWLVVKKKRGKRQSADSYESGAYSLPNLEDSTSRRDHDRTRRDSNLPVFDLKYIIAATDNFSVAILLGKGGFGSIYKIWDQWNEGKAMEIVDPSLGVQEHVTNRPTMSAVVFMLGSDTPPPSPKQPAFIFNNTCNTKNQIIIEGANSVNEITITKIDDC
nr:G-type lectin S-receptor-like serine/threonine-protein kinase At1g11410 [Quercus suber]